MKIKLTLLVNFILTLTIHKAMRIVPSIMHTLTGIMIMHALSKENKKERMIKIPKISNRSAITSFLIFMLSLSLISQDTQYPHL